MYSSSLLCSHAARYQYSKPNKAHMRPARPIYRQHRTKQPGTLATLTRIKNKQTTEEGIEKRAKQKTLPSTIITKAKQAPCLVQNHWIPSFQPVAHAVQTNSRTDRQQLKQTPKTRHKSRNALRLMMNDDDDAKS
jgi:hypothetical protein